MLVRMIWKVEETGLQQRTERILPKGNVEIIFNLSDNIYGRKIHSENIINLPNCLVNGINLTPYEILKNGDHCFFGIQLNPFALRLLFNVSVSELNDKVISSELLCSRMNELAAQVAEAGTFQKQTAVVLKWLRNKITEARLLKFDSRVAALYFDTEIQYYSVSSLSKKYNLSDRHMRRMAAEWLGMCPADFILYRKYLKALYEIHKKKDSLTGIAYESGFYDQAHLIRTFRLFTGYSPGEYKKQMSHLPGHVFIPGT